MEFIRWILEFAGDKVAEKLFEKLIPPELERNLDKNLDAWMKSLPKHLRFEQLAIFDSRVLDPRETNHPEIAQLADKLAKGRIPGKDDWLTALYYIWSVKYEKWKNRDAQEFFKLDPSKAKHYLSRLAERFEKVCRENGSLFNVEVIARMDENAGTLNIIVEQLKNISSDVGVLNSKGMRLDFQENLTFANRYLDLQQSLFVCQAGSKLFLGVAISNSGLVVCGGEEESIAVIRLLRDNKPVRIIGQKWNGVHFLFLNSVTKGVTWHFPLPQWVNDERYLLYDSQANIVLGSPLKITDFPELNFFYDLLIKSKGFIVIQLDKAVSSKYIASSPVFTDRLEFVGISTVVFRITNSKNRKITALLIVSAQKYFSAFWPEKKKK